MSLINDTLVYQHKLTNIARADNLFSTEYNILRAIVIRNHYSFSNFGVEFFFRCFAFMIDSDL